MKRILIMLIIFLTACSTVNDTKFLCTAMKNAIEDNDTKIVYDEGWCIVSFGESIYVYTAHCKKENFLNVHYIDFMFKTNETMVVDDLEDNVKLHCKITQLK